MDDTSEKKRPRRKPGASFFMVAMAFYLVLVHGSSLWGKSVGSTYGEPVSIPDTWPWFLDFLNRLGGNSSLTCVLLTLPLMYGIMLCIFRLTRLWVGGPIWLGSLAGTFFMAHPAKTEMLFSPNGIYHLLATLTALGALLAYSLHRVRGGLTSYSVAVLLFAAASYLFIVNAAFFGVFLLLEFMLGDTDRRNWLRPLPLLFLAMGANWIHLDTLYQVLPTPDTQFGPLILILYPIGFLPETVARFGTTPWLAWVWGMVAFLTVVGLCYAIKSRAFRLAVLAIVLFRFYPGPLPLDYETMQGGAQLGVPIALAGVALAALSNWLMKFPVWGQPTVALTTMLCVVLFVVQFQANRTYIDGLETSTPAARPAEEERDVAYRAGTAGYRGEGSVFPCSG